MPASRKILHLALGSLLVGLTVLVLKMLAWWWTGSLALLSDALESMVNVAAAAAVLIAIRVAAIPADDNHPYGHHKAEFFSAVLEGVLIVLAALFILREAWDAFQAPRAIAAPLSGMMINAAASVLNLIWARVLLSRGKSLRSPALVADGKHLMTDVWSSLGVLIGVVLAFLTGWWILDPIMAVLVAVNILWSGFVLIQSSLSGLLDESLPEDQLDRLRQIIMECGEGAVEAHDLRTRHAGRVTFVDFHLVVPGDMTVEAAHILCDRIEDGIRAAQDDARITIHVEPDHKAKHDGTTIAF